MVHCGEMSREMNEKMIASHRQKQQLDMMMKIGVKSIKVLPVEQEKSLGKLDYEETEVEAERLTIWVLKYIEFIGNFVILVFMVAFISIYWCIGTWSSLL